MSYFPLSFTQFLYAYDFARLYVVICIATSDSLQFLFPESTTCGNGITLWNNIITKLFGLTYKDAFEAAEKLRRWNIDPSKPLQHDIHNLMLLVKRANETAKTILPETSILGMIYDAISKDPRDELRMLGSNSSFGKQTLEQFLTTLSDSTHTGPFNPRSVKMSEFKPKTTHYCNNFQEGKCRLGDKCRYEHKINPDYKKRDIGYEEKKKNTYIIPNKNNNKKFQDRKKNFSQHSTSGCSHFCPFAHMCRFYF